MSIKIIDKFQGNAILKIIRPNGKVIYQTMPEACVGKDASQTVQHTTLSDARVHLGMPAPKVQPLTSGKKYTPRTERATTPTLDAECFCPTAITLAVVRSISASITRGEHNG